MKRRNQGNHKEEKFRECKQLWYELREKPKPQTRPLIRIIVEKPSPSKQAKPSLLFQQIECGSVRETQSSFSSAITDEVSHLSPLSVCRSHPLPSLFLYQNLKDPYQQTIKKIETHKEINTNTDLKKEKKNTYWKNQSVFLPMFFFFFSFFLSRSGLVVLK